MYLQKNISQMNALRIKNESVAAVTDGSCDCSWLDMSQVKFIDSAGLSAIATVCASAKQRDCSLVLGEISDLINFHDNGVQSIHNLSS